MIALREVRDDELTVVWTYGKRPRQPSATPDSRNRVTARLPHRAPDVRACLLCLPARWSMGLRPKGLPRHQSEDD